MSGDEMINFEGKDAEYAIRADQFVDQTIKSYLAKTKTCSICHCFPRSPVTINNVDDGMSDPCGHLFCLSCISDWLARNDTCPVCRRYSKMEDIVKAKNIEQELGGLAVTCKHKSRGCTWARSNGLNGQDYLEHVKECKFRRDTCPLCKAEVSDIAVHQTECPEEMIECTLNDRCQTWMRRKELDKHIQHSCWYRIVECPRRSICSLPACRRKFTSSELRTHEDAYRREHLEAETEARKRTQEKLDGALKMVATISEECKKIRNLLIDSHERVICPHQYKLVVPMWDTPPAHGGGGGSDHPTKSQAFNAAPDPPSDLAPEGKSEAGPPQVKQWILTAKKTAAGKARLELILKSASYPRMGNVTVYLAKGNDHLALPTRRLNFSTVKAAVFEFETADVRSMIKADGSLIFIVVVESNFHPCKPKKPKAPKSKKIKSDGSSDVKVKRYKVDK